MRPAIITAAICGAETTRQMTPHLPITAYELECYDVGHVEACLRLAEEGVIELPAHFDFVMGVRGGIQASEDNLTFLVMKLPQGCTFNVAGIGRHQLPMAELSLRMGGHARCGLEDNVYLSKGVLAKGSFELVARVAELARADRPCIGVNPASETAVVIHLLTH